MQTQTDKLTLLERIVEEQQDRLFRFAYFRTGSRPDAEDIVQETLLRLFRSECDLSRVEDVERYLWRAIANRCTDHHRRRRPFLPADELTDRAEDPADRELHDEYLRIARLLDDLPDKQAEVIRLKTIDTLTFPQIAELTNSSEATVKSRFRYGIRKLREKLSGTTR